MFGNNYCNFLVMLVNHPNAGRNAFQSPGKSTDNSLI